MSASELSLADLEASDNKFAVTELMVFFRKLRISPKDARSYAQRLVDLGYDDVQALCEDVGEEELKDIGMRPGHVKRVKRALTNTDWTTYSINNDEQSDYDSAVSPGPSRVNSSADLLAAVQQPLVAAPRRPPATILPSDPSDWTYYDTIQWLSQFEELRQERVFSVFEHLRVDGSTLIRLQTSAEIDKLDIPAGPARERFVKELFKLQHQRDTCSSSDAQDASSRKTRSNLGTITEDEEASDGETRPDAILTHVPSFCYRKDETEFYSSAVGDLSGISDTEEVRRNLAAAILEPREVPRRRSSLTNKSQDSDHSKRASRAHRQTVSDDDAYAEPKRAVSAVQHRPKSQHETQSARPTHRREKSTSAPPSAYVEPLSGIGAPGSAGGGEPDVATTRRARRPSKKLKSAKSARRLSLTAPMSHGGGMSTDNGSDEEEEDVKTLLVANNSDADGLSGVEADVDAELSLLSSHYQPSKMAKAFKPNLRVDITHTDSARSSPVTPRDAIKGAGSQDMSPGDLSEQEGQRGAFHRLLRAAGSSNQKLKRPKSLMQFAPGGQLHLQLGSSARSQTTHFTEQGTFQAGGFQLGPNGISGVPESLRNTMSPSSSPIATPKYTREATILLEELGRGACGTVQKGIYVPALTMVAVKFVQVHDNDRRRQMVRELKAFYSMSVSSFEDDDEPEYAPNASSASLLSQNSESSTLQGRLSDGPVRQPLDEVSQNPEVITTQEPGKRKRVKRRSPFIVNFYDAYTDPERGAVAIVLEYMNAGSLQDLIHNNIRPDEEMIATIAYSVLHGLHAIHTRQIIHRDVKPGNILLTRDGHVKLSDFGVMRELVDTINARTFTGTMYYMSPERIRGEKYSFQSDIWSLGVSLITLATGNIPFPTDSGYWGLIGAIQDGPPPSLPEDMLFSPDLRDFVNECVKLDQQERPTADILLNHPFLLKTLKLEPNSFNQCPPGHVPKLKLPASFAPSAPRNVDQIIDSILEWQMEHLLDEEYFPSIEPSRRHSISNAGEREHKDMLIQKLTLIQYSPRQVSRLANQMWLNPEVLQQAFSSRWEAAEEQLRNSDFLLHFAQPPFTSHQLRQRAWMEERAQYSDSASSAYGTPRAAHHHRPSAGDAMGARRRSLLSRRTSHSQAVSGYSSASGRGSDLDTNELLRPAHAAATAATAERKTAHGHASASPATPGGGLEVVTHPHVPKDSPPPTTPTKSPGALASPADKKLQQLKAFFQAQPQGIISPIATDDHSSSFMRKSMGRRRTSSRSLTDLDEMETEAATPRMIEKPNSPLLMMPHPRRPSTGHSTRTNSDNMAGLVDALLANSALPPAEAKGPELSILPPGVFPSEQELLGGPKSGDGCFHGTERKGMHQRSRSRGYASHVRNLSSSTNSSTNEKYRPNRSKPRSRRRSLPDEVFSSGAMPSMGTLAMSRAKVTDPAVPRRNTICTVPPQDSSVVSVYGPVSDDDTCTENFQWSLPTSAATRPQSAVSPYDDAVDTELSKDALIALELDAAVDDLIDP